VRAGERDQARALIDRGLKLVAGDAAKRFGFGNLLLANQDFALAGEVFESLAAEQGSHPALSYNLAYVKFGEARYADAISLLLAVSEAEQAQLPQYHLLLGKAMYYDQRLDAALEQLDRYLVAQPKDREALGFKALVAFDLGQPESAQATAKTLLGLEPNDVFGHLVLGSLAMERRDPNVAKAHLGVVVKQRPDMGRAWSVLGFADLQENQLETGREHFELAVKHMPNHLGTWHGLAWTQMLLGNLPAARQAVDRAMDYDRTFSENHGTLAVLLVLEGKLDEAEASIKRGLRLDPKSPSSHYARSLLLAERNNPDASRKLIERILTEAGMKDAAKIAELAVGFRPGQMPQKAPQKKAAPAAKTGPKPGKGETIH
jgi:tetratricopeptide (TPR) repeat protein